MLFDCGVVLVVVKIMVGSLSTKGSANHGINFLFPIVMLSVYTSGFLRLFCFFFCVVVVFMATMKNTKYKIQNQEMQYQKMQYQSTSTHPPTSSQQQWLTTINETRKMLNILPTTWHTTINEK